MNSVALIRRVRCMMQFACCLVLAGCADGRLAGALAEKSNGKPPDMIAIGAADAATPLETQNDSSEEPATYPTDDQIAVQPPPFRREAPDSETGPALKTASGAAGTLTFKDALDLAEANSSGIAGGRRAVQRAEDRRQELEASYASDFMLRLVGNSDQGIDSTAFEDTDDNRAGEEELGAELRWTPPWWHKRTLLMDAQLAGLDRKIAEVQSEEAYVDLAVEIYRRYLTVLLQRARLKISADSLTAVETRYRATADSQALGLASPLNALLDETNVSNQRAEVAADVSQLKDDLNSLYQMLGKPFDDSKLCSNYFAFSDYVGEVGDSRAAAVDQARTIALEIEKRRQEKSEKEEIWMPRLSLSASYAHGFDQEGRQPDDVTSFGIELAVPLPNFEAARLQQQSSAQEVSYLESTLAKSEADAERRIRDMQAAIQTSKEKLRLRAEAVEKQQERIAALRKSLEIGQITRAELEILEDAAKSTRIAYVESLFGHLMRIAELNRQYGKLPHVPDSCEEMDILGVAN